MRVLALLVLLLIGVESLAQNRPEPLQERRIDIAPFDRTATSPTGRQRVTAVEGRQFAISPDGKLIASEDAGGWQLELWDAETGKSLGKFGEINDPVSLTFSPDGHQLLAADRNEMYGCAVELWDVKRREKIRQLDEGANLYPFFGLAFSPNGKMIALAPAVPRNFNRSRNTMASVYLWDVASGDEVSRLAAANMPGAAAAVAADEEAVRMARAASRGMPSLLSTIAWSPDGRNVAGVVDRRILLWEIASGELRGELGRLPALSANVRAPIIDPRFGVQSNPSIIAASMAFSPDGLQIASGCSDGSIRRWSVRERVELPPLVGHEGSIRAISYAANGETLLSLGTDNRLLTWSTQVMRPEYQTSLDETAFAQAWQDLQSSDPYLQSIARARLAAAAEQSITWLRDNVKPVMPADVEKLKPLLADLEHDDFNLRKRASRELAAAGEAGVLALQQPRPRPADRVAAAEFDASGGSQMTVLRSRMLARFTRQFPTQEQRRAQRAVEVSERIGTEEATKLLTEYAKGAPGSMLATESQSALERLAGRRASNFGSAALEALWKELAGSDAAKAYTAVEELIRRGEKALPVLSENLDELVSGDALDSGKRIVRLIADLDSDDFALRETATQELTKFGPIAAPAVRDALNREPTAEAKQRLTAILAAGGRSAVTGERLQALRAIEVLESIGTPAARQALEAASKQVPEGLWIAQTLAESLERLSR